MILIPLGQARATSSQGIENVRTSFEARHYHNQKTGESDIFIGEKQQNRVIVSESELGKGLLVGPLPDFAIIEYAGPR